jgi:hypothetical protein
MANDKPDPLIDQLAGFTPAPAAVDRDAILFEAGKAAGRRSRVWPALTGLLAATQAATLALWMMQPLPPTVANKARAPKDERPPPRDAPPTAIAEVMPLLPVQDPALLRPAAELVPPAPPLAVAAAYRNDEI